MPWVRNYEIRPLLPITRGTGSTEGNDVDLQGLINPGGREMKAILNYITVGTDTDETLVVKIQESDDTVAANFADITGAAFAQINNEDANATVELHFVAQKRFLRAIATAAGTTPLFDISLNLLGELRMA